MNNSLTAAGTEFDGDYNQTAKMGSAKQEKF